MGLGRSTVLAACKARGREVSASWRALMGSPLRAQWAAALAWAGGVALPGCATNPADRPFPRAASFAIQGIDVSKCQGDGGWVAVAASGVRFAWIKATEGGDYLDEKFRQNWEASRAAGVIRATAA